MSTAEIPAPNLVTETVTMNPGPNLVNAARPAVTAIKQQAEETIARFHENMTANMLVQAFIAGYQHRQEIEKLEAQEAANGYVSADKRAKAIVTDGKGNVVGAQG